MATDTQDDREHDGDEGMQKQMYLRFAAMIVTGMVVMYFVMFVASWELSHMRFSQSRTFMTLTMGGAMGLVMLAWVLNMYKSVTADIIVVVVSLPMSTKVGADPSSHFLPRTVTVGSRFAWTAGTPNSDGDAAARERRDQVPSRTQRGHARGTPPTTRTLVAIEHRVQPETSDPPNLVANRDSLVTCRQ